MASAVKVFDTHLHFNLLRGGISQAQSMARRAVEHNVRGLTIVGVDAESSVRAKEVCEELRPQFPSLNHLNWSAGIHPKRADLLDSDFDAIRKLVLQETKGSSSNGGSSSSLPRCVAVGECGLDFFRASVDSEQQQRECLARHFELADETGLPLIIHCRSGPDRDAYDLFRDITMSHPPSKGKRPRRGVIHCFSGKAKQALALASMPEQDWKISFPCTIGYRKSHELRDAAAKLPLSSIVVETDSPWLPPQHLKYGGGGGTQQRRVENEPSNVNFALDEVVNARQRVNADGLGQMSFGDARKKVAEALWTNSCRLFQL